jgi:ABC-type Zn uptake system ZnuABC Zn-binding protein ZnuA
MKQTISRIWGTLIALLVLVLACSGCRVSRTTSGQAGEIHTDEMPELSALSLDPGSQLRVVATTNIVADVVRQVGGTQIGLATLLPPGADPHAFEPTPQDIAAVADAHVVFTNGAGLEVFLEALLQSANQAAAIVPVSAGVDLLQFAGDSAHAGERQRRSTYLVRSAKRDRVDT